MDYQESELQIKGAVKDFMKLRESFNHEVLEDSYLVLDYGKGQIPLSKLGLAEMGFHEALLVKNERGKYLINLAQKRGVVEYQIQELKKILDGIDRRISKVNVIGLELNPFTIEVRFRTLNSELIQKIKQSEFCDSEKTDMSLASIRIILRS
ncbi:hypothetical protein KKC91_09225 [bacterium]|nr:hypothetical protein [bacterium]